MYNLCRTFELSDAIIDFDFPMFDGFPNWNVLQCWGWGLAMGEGGDVRKVGRAIAVGRA